LLISFGKGERQLTYHQETEFVQIGNERDEHYRAVSTPVYFSTAFRHEEIGLLSGYDYTRTGNPTRDVLEKSVALLEKGERAFATSSGMSAIQLVFSLFEKDDHIIASRDIYGGSYRLFEIFEAKYGVTFSYWDGESIEELKGLIHEGTKAIFIETPTNPLMKETDIKQISAITKRYELLCIVDNTLYTPYIQRPLEEGADIVIHSATKYLAGHNDVLAGLVVSKGEKINDELAFLHNSIGAVLGPLDCWNLIRGMKTLALRMDKHEENAKEIVPFLQAHPLVDEVFYPGRGGMLSFIIANEAQVSPFLKALKLFTFAESLGGVESFITYPKTQTHGDIPEEIRLSYGLSNSLLRLSVGIEHASDLIADLKHAFKEVEGSVSIGST
jgi:cystathionine gamma-synthase